MDYHGFGYIVDSCPINETEQTAAASRLNCGVDEYRNSQYVCAPNAQRTAIVEYCYRSTVGLQSPGTCLKVFSDGSYDAVSCTNFIKGCTTDYFSSADLYKYPACHQINPKDRCYYEDPACPNINKETAVSSNETFTSTPKGLSNSTDTPLNYTIDTTIQPDDNVLKAVITGSFAGVLVLAFLLVLVCILRWRKMNRDGKNREREEELDSFVNPDSDVQCRTTPTAIKSTCVDDESKKDDAKVFFGSSIEIEDVLKTIDGIVPELSDESIANQLVIALDYSGFKKLLQKCKKEVSFVNSGTPSEEAKLCVSEVTVSKFSKLGFVVQPKSNVDQFHREVRGLPRAYLVSSEFISTIEAKLAVYRQFKEDIDVEGIRIHHVFDEPEDFLNHCGHFTIDSFQMNVEELKNIIRVAEVKRIVTQAADHAFSYAHIRNTCRELYLTDKGDDIGTVRDKRYDCRSHFTVSRIKGNLVEQTLHDIGKTFCNNIFREIFEYVRSSLEQNIEADHFSISDETFMKCSAHTAVKTVVVEMLLSIVGRMTAVSIFFTFLWSVNINSPEWRDKVCDEIYNQMSEKKERIVADVTGIIEQIREKTIEELRSTITGLDDTKKHVCPLTQKQIADEWMLRDIRIEGIDKHRSKILKVIGGRVGHRIKIKVFLASMDEEIIQFVKENIINAPTDAKLVFVDTSPKKNRLKLKAKEEKVQSNDQQIRKELDSIVNKEEEKLYAKHSTIIAIGTSLVRQVDQEFIYDPCIVIRCLDKELIPFGETKIPDNLNGFPCDIRKDFFRFGTCRTNSHRIVPGCSIGNTVQEYSGSVGFLARENTDSKSGFITAAHAVLPSDILGQLNETRLTEIPNVYAQGPFNILHPSKEDGHPHSVVIGEVTESYFGNHDDVGIDAAFVKFTNEHEEKLYKQTEEVLDEQGHFAYPIEAKVVRRKDVDVNGNLKVYKRGRATGVTEGRLNGETSLRMSHPFCKYDILTLKHCFQIYDDKESFFEGGDSGAGVFLLVEDTRLQPLAIAFGKFLSDNGVTMACPLENVLSALDVSIQTPAEQYKCDSTFI